MSVSMVQWLANFGVAGLVILAIMLDLLVPGNVYKDLKAANEKLADALAIERQRNADLQQMAATGTKAMNALAELAEERREEEQRRRRRHSGTPPSGIPAAAGR